MTNTTLPARPGKSFPAKKSKTNTPSKPNLQPLRGQRASSEQANTVLGKRKGNTDTEEKGGAGRQPQKKVAAGGAVPGRSTRVVPATPGAIVNLSSTQQGTAQPEPDGGAPLASRKKNKKRQNGRESADGQTNTGETQKIADKEPQQNRKKQRGPPPSMLPREPHEGLLADLEPKYNVLLLSVISSTKMEKRIAAVMNHIQAGTAQSSRPGVVLLHARARDATKMISIVEIVKRRIREGFFVAKGTEEARPQDKAWFQYNRVYDVETEPNTPEAKEQKEQEASGGAQAEDEEEEEDDDFEPVPQRFQEAAGVAPRKTVTVTYMSIFLSRTTVPELQKKPDITTQASTDQNEIEYQEWISRQV